MTNVLLAGFTSHWLRRKSSMRTTGENPQALRGCPQRPENLERNARTILLNSKGAENQQKNQPKVKCFLLTFLLTFLLIELFGQVDKFRLADKPTGTCGLTSAVCPSVLALLSPTEHLS
jgi:hypothetical protein